MTSTGKDATMHLKCKLSQIRPSASAHKRLNEEISAYYSHVSPTKVEYEVRLLMIELIIRAIHKTWPDAIVTPFGSWQTQLYLPTG